MSERQFIRLGALKFLICSFIYSVGAAEPLLVVGDPIIPVGEIIGSNSSYPAAEGPGNVLDGNSNTKYLNFGRLRSGFIVTPSAGSSVGRAFTISTANDFEGRDPVNWELFGTNEAVITVAHQSGFGREPRTLIANGTLSLPVDREIAGSQVIFNNNDAFTFYKWICRSMKDTAENSLQFSEFQFDCDPTLHRLRGSETDASSQWDADPSGLDL